MLISCQLSGDHRRWVEVFSAIRRGVLVPAVNHPPKLCQATFSENLVSCHCVLAAIARTVLVTLGRMALGNREGLHPSNLRRYG